MALDDQLQVDYISKKCYKDEDVNTIILQSDQIQEGTGVTAIITKIEPISCFECLNLQNTWCTLSNLEGKCCNPSNSGDLPDDICS